MKRLRASILSSRPARSVRRLLGYDESLRDLPYILDQAKPHAPLAEKVAWVEQLMEWVRSGTELSHDFDTSTGQLYTVRVRFLLQLLERNPHWKAAVAENLRAVFRETSAVELFCQTGLSQESGFFSEGADRVLKKLLPVPPKNNDLSEIFERVFRDETDATWMRHLPPETFNDILALFQHGNPEPDTLFENLRTAILESLLILGSNVSAQGLHPAVRSRLPGVAIGSSPFLRLNQNLSRLVFDLSQEDAKPLELSEISAGFQPLIDECKVQIEAVLEHLEVSGVSVNLVYRLETLSHSLTRIETLLKLLVIQHLAERQQIILNFTSDLILERLSSSTVTQLIENNLHLLSRKIVERTGASGEHYITRNRAEYVQMLQSAAGGGLLTVGTTVIKFAVSNLKLPYFFDGLFATVNYAGSFVMMQLMGFTLATKQPSMTASALAGKLNEIKKPEDVNEFVTEIIRITRSQFAAAAGNVGMVIPGAIALEMVIRLIFGRSVIGVETAQYVVASLHPFKSLTIPFAALTGVILWLSSIFAGWIENWVVYRQIPEAISQNRRLIAVFGPERTESFAKWFLHNTSGFGGSISLGTFLAFTPIAGRFFGLPLDVRHVTLSSGSLTFAVCSMIGAGAVDRWAIAGAALGILFIGLLNFGVSFALALGVAARARNVNSTWIWTLLKIGWLRLRRSPREFFLPPPAGLDDKIESQSH
ncbi:MAG TPA: site-specific recombinase [Bdellovibrionales bacterium]|nr:site-specific recombinase [Bdellovibrionales bacterium]